MMITLRGFMQANCSDLMNSEEFLLETNREFGIKGTSINEDGEVVYSDDSGVEVLLRDIIILETVDDLKKIYPEIKESILYKLQTEFRRKYKIVDMEEYQRMESDNLKAQIDDMDLLDSLAYGWD